MSLKALIDFFIPPPKWRLAASLTGGILIGLIAFLFRVSNATSYLGDAPETCVNCHVMQPQFATWFHSSHREVATCNDCHVPHNNFVNKYYFKAKDGLRHATMFTLRAEPQVMRIGDDGKEVVQKNCIRCHSDLLEDPLMAGYEQQFNVHRTDRPCWDCHREIPHGRVTSLASTFNTHVSKHADPIPQWIHNLLNKKVNNNKIK